MKCAWCFAVTGSSRGYAFVEYETEKEMRHAYKVVQLLESFNFTWVYPCVLVFGLFFYSFSVWCLIAIKFVGCDVILRFLQRSLGFFLMNYWFLLFVQPFLYLLSFIHRSSRSDHSWRQKNLQLFHFFLEKYNNKFVLVANDIDVCYKLTFFFRMLIIQW